ncbi:hypothetical protein [Petrotoga sp. 9PW.55.5.1]|uniref:hypothetical protein n=1 Tax=Petrotoga sp. 9PW.55.5.1 TaxID=1308979 RepID=UPI000DD5A563|nr:hypothetical protein [Petrotoga sp. 9PW.55.5.1]
MKLIETLPNISEGKNIEIIEQIKHLSDKFERVWFISCRRDEYFNRSFISLVGDLPQIEEFLFQMVRLCIDKIDLRNHTGYHPRIGAVDVIPIIPLLSVNPQEANQLVERLSKRLAESLSLPIYLYENSAKTEKRKNINYIRKGEFEFLSKKMALPEWKPDFGPDTPHPTAGATVIGVRDFLISLEFHISTFDRWLAEQIRQELIINIPGSVFLERKQNSRFSLTINAKEGDISLYLLYSETKKIINHFGCEIEKVTLSSPLTGKLFLQSFRSLIGNLDGELFTIEEILLNNSEITKNMKVENKD